jgi:hypothetical protein
MKDVRGWGSPGLPDSAAGAGAGTGTGTGTGTGVSASGECSARGRRAPSPAAAPDPGRFLELFCSWLAASKANKWNGRNITRWRNDEYDTTFRAAEGEIDPVKRAAH